MAESVDPVESDAELEAAVQRSFGLIYAMSSWPGAAKTWLMTTSTKLDGVREVAQTLVHDADADLVVLSVRAFETCSTDKESVTMYRDESYSVIATMTAESSTDSATALSAVVVADGGNGLCGLTNATSTLPSWIGVKDDLSVVGFVLWLPRHTSDSRCSRHVNMPCHFDWGFVRCGECS